MAKRTRPQPKNDKGQFLSTHGVYARHKDKRYLDGRYAPAKILNEYIGSLADQGGGFDNLTATQRGRLYNIRMTLVTLSQISEHIAEKETIFKGEHLIPVVARNQSTYQRDFNTFLREYEASINSAKPLMSLEDYLKQAKEQETGKRKSG